MTDDRPATAAFAPQLTLHYSPRACSLAPHIVLEESGLSYQALAVDIRAGQNTHPEYLKINPSGTVPALQAGNTVITEAHAILAYIADLAPECELIPRTGTRARAKAHEWMNWISGTVHVTYRSIFRPQTYAGDNPQAIYTVREHGERQLARVLLEIESRLGDAEFALGSRFSVVDAYLFVFYLWSFDERLQQEVPTRPRYAALAGRVWSRTAARTAVARERLVRAYTLPPQFGYPTAARGV